MTFTKAALPELKALSKAGRIFISKKFWISMALSLTLITVTGSDSFHQTKLEKAAGSHTFSIFWWEIRHAPVKWTHLLWELFPGNKPNDKERIVIVQSYLQSVKRLDKEVLRLSQPHLSAEFTGSTTGGRALDHVLENIKTFEREKESLRGRAEESVEAALSKTIVEEGLGFRFGIIFPPTDFRFDEPPLLLVTSPRNEIKLEASILIDNNIDSKTRSDIERKAELDGQTSALVDNLSGLGTYPAIVSDRYELRQLTRTAAHEWLHNYWIFQPLGRSMWNSPEMYTLNETAADIAGDELGDRTFLKLGGDLSISSQKYASVSVSRPHLSRILKQTRKEVERLLSLNNIAAAEKLMRKQHWTLKLGGYNIRKINQAYFAFRGNYADGPASTSQIGPELSEFRNHFETLGEFIVAISKVDSYHHFKLQLYEKRGSAGTNEELENP